MSLVLAIPTGDGVVLASDGETTAGEIRTAGPKLRHLTARCAWGAVGEVSVIQRVEDALGAAPPGSNLDALRDHVASAVRESMSALMQLDFRTPYIQHDPAQLVELHPADFVFAEFDGRARILHVPPFGTTEWIDRAFATGSAAVFAYALLKKYEGVEFTLRQASILAFKVIEEAIAVGAYGVGPPIAVWQVVQDETRELVADDLAMVSDAARTLRAAEVELLRADGARHGTRVERGAAPRRPRRRET